MIKKNRTYWTGQDGIDAYKHDRTGQEPVGQQGTKKQDRVRRTAHDKKDRTYWTGQDRIAVPYKHGRTVQDAGRTARIRTGI